MQRRHFISSALLAALGTPALARAPAARQRPEWAAHFEAAGVRGSLLVCDERPGGAGLQVFDEARAGQRFVPASTFKIPHSLFALDAGIVRDEFQVLRWDGVQRWRPAWNADQTLRSALRESTVWVYERFARQLGPAREAAYLRRIGYGNGRVSGAAPFWVEGDLAISSFEQLAMLQRLYRNTLPFAVAHQRLVKDLMVNEAGPGGLLRGKTGWSGRIGWWVGWVERHEGAVFFVLNIDTPRRQDDLPHRQGITEAVLQTLQAWPLGEDD